MSEIVPNNPMFDRIDLIHRRNPTIRIEQHFYYTLQPSFSPIDNQTITRMSLIEFGKITRDQHYLLDLNVTYVNHGSYGPCPRMIFDELQKIRLEQEQNPDKWFRISKYNYYWASVCAAAEYLNCDVNQIVVVENPTVAINSILKSPLSMFLSTPGGTILCTNLAYGAVQFTIQEATRNRGMKIRMVNVRLPLRSKDEFIQVFENELAKGDVSNIRLAVIDHITSATAILFPIEELTDLFHRHGIPVLIDGAHGPGQVNPQLSLNDLKCDFYVGALHKWMYAPRGCSFLFVRDAELRKQIQPANTSWGYQPSASQLKLMSHFHLQFFHQGTRDDSSLLILPKVIKFIDHHLGGFKTFHHYNSSLSEMAKNYLEHRWQMSKTDLVPPSMQAPYLKMIRLPDLNDYQKTDEDALRLINDLIEHHRVVAIILCVEKELYIRIATQIYNRIHDYILLADVIDRLRKIK